MAEAWIVEQQVGGSDVFALLALSPQRVCDSADTSTIHRRFVLAAGELVSGQLTCHMSTDRKGESVPVWIVVAPSFNRSRYFAVRDIGKVTIPDEVHDVYETAHMVQQAIDVPDTVWVADGDTCDTMDGVSAATDGRRLFHTHDAGLSAPGSTHVPAEQPGLDAQIVGFTAGLVDMLAFWTGVTNRREAVEGGAADVRSVERRTSQRRTRCGLCSRSGC